MSNFKSEHLLYLQEKQIFHTKWYAFHLELEKKKRKGKPVFHYRKEIWNGQGKAGGRGGGGGEGDAGE